MADYYGDRWSGNPQDLMLSRQSLKWRDLVGQGSDLFTESINIDDGIFDNDSIINRYIVHGGELTGPFATDVPAIKDIKGHDIIQIEKYLKNEFTYSDAFRTAISPDWGNSDVDVTDNDIIAPNGIDYADKIIPYTSIIAHYIAQSITPDGSSQYTQSIFVKAAGYNRIRLWANTAGFTTNFYSDFNLTTGERYAGDCDIYSIDVIGNGWYRVRTTGTSDLATISSIRFFVLNDSGDSVFSGDGTKGLHLWRANFTKSHHLSSPIYSGATQGEREKDEINWPAGTVPEWFRDNKFAFRFIPRYSTIEAAGMNFFVLKDLTTGDRVSSIMAATGSVYVYKNAETLLNTPAVTFSTDQEILFIYDSAEGSVEIIGATTGNGKTIGSSGWDNFIGSNSVLYWGQNNNYEYQVNALMSAPYRHEV